MKIEAEEYGKIINVGVSPGANNASILHFNEKEIQILWKLYLDRRNNRQKNAYIYSYRVSQRNATQIQIFIARMLIKLSISRRCVH